MDVSEDLRQEEHKKSARGFDKPQRTILFSRSENASELREEHYDETFSSNALKTYLKHIGYCKSKKRRRCLSMELDRILDNECGQ